MDFNKKHFASLLILARGDRSINRYGADSGVDPGYISRLSRGLVNTPPSAMIINKMADAAQNKVTAAELMIAAGYLNPASITSPDHKSTNIKLVDWPEWEKVIEEAAKYQISPEVAVDLIRSLGRSLEQMKK